MAHFPWRFYVKNFHLRRKTRYKTSDNFSAENIVLVKSADPVMETFQNPSQFCHIGQEERTGAITAVPQLLGMENSSLGATQSLIKSRQQHFLNTKKFEEERKNSNQKKLFPLGCVSWASLTPPPSLQCCLPGDLDALTPGGRRGRQDGWEALSLHREWDGAGPWGGGPGL